MNVDEIVQACLIELEAGRATVADLVARYPGVEGLEAQLRAAQGLRRLSQLTLRPEASRAHEQLLRAALHAAANRPAPRPARFPWLRLPAVRFPALFAQSPALRFGLAAVLVAALVLASTGAASAASLPGQWLYAVKQTYERVQVRLTPSTGQAALHASLAEARTEELIRLSQRDSQTGLVATTVAAMNAEAGLSLDFVPQAETGQQADLLERLIHLSDRQQAILTQVAARAPAEAQAGLENAQQSIAARRQQALARLEAAHNGAGAQASASPTQTPTPGPTATPRVPPGQTKIAPRRTAEATNAHGSPAETEASSEETHVAPGQTRTPPGQDRVTATPRPRRVAATATRAARPDCSSSNPNSPNYCTPVPGGGNNLPPTSCPLNPAGKPRC